MGPRTVYVDSREHLRSGPGHDPPRKRVEISDLTEKDFHEVCLEIQCYRTPFGDYLYVFSGRLCGRSFKRANELDALRWSFHREDRLHMFEHLSYANAAISHKITTTCGTIQLPRHLETLLPRMPCLFPCML